MSEEKVSVAEIEATINKLDEEAQRLRAEKLRWAELLERANARESAAAKLEKMSAPERAAVADLLKG